MENKYRYDAEKILKAYKDDNFAYSLVKSSALEMEMDSSFSSKSDVVFPAVNFITDTLSKMYIEKVVRRNNEKYSDNEELVGLTKIVSDAFDNISNTLDKYTFMTGLVGLKPFYNAEIDSFKYLMYPSHMIEYTPLYNDYSEAQEIQINYDTEGVSQKEVWSNNYFYFSTDDKEFKDGNSENIYGEIPFVFFKNNKDNIDFFEKPKKNLLKSQNMLSKMLVNIDATFKKQGSALLIAKGIGDIKDIKVGPNSINSLPEDGDLKYITPDLNMVDMVEFLKEQFSLISKLEGVPDSLFNVNNTSSGVSIVASQKVVQEYIKTRQRIFLNSEKEAIEMGVRILAYHKGIEVPEDFEVQINYKRQIESLTKDEIDQWNFYIENNIYTSVDIIMQLEDLSRVDAIAKIKENYDLNNQYKIVNEKENTNNTDEIVEN